MHIHRWIYTCNHERFCRVCGEHQFKDKFMGTCRLEWRSVWNYKEHGILKEVTWWFSMSQEDRDLIAEECGLAHKKCGGSYSYDYIIQMYAEKHEKNLDLG